MLLESINQQITNEMYSGYLYLSMAAHFEAEGLPGFARWMRLQAQEELEHAMKFFDFVNDRGERVTLNAIERPPAEFGTPLDIFEMVLEHEEEVTSLIHDLYETALEEQDYATQVMLHWFIDEQIEEERAASDIVALLERAGDDGPGLLMLDRQMGERVAD
jgi:ferritin